MRESGAEKFNRAARKQDASVFDYAREVAQVWKDFPEARAWLSFIDLCADPVAVYAADEAVKRNAGERLSQQTHLSVSVKSMKEVEQSSCYVSLSRAVLLYTAKHKFPFLDKAAAQAQETVFVFDHELGHALIPNALYADGKNKAECIADAYAVIRHLQRYGADSPVIDRIVQQRAFQFIFRRDRMSHYTSPVTEQILARRHDIAWDRLTPAETAELAWRFALKYALHPVLLGALDSAFISFHGRIDDISKCATASLQNLAESVLLARQPEVFKCGVRALQLCFDGQVDGISLTGDYWNDVRRKLAGQQETMERDGDLLFGLGKDAPRKADHNVIKFPGRRL